MNGFGRILDTTGLQRGGPTNIRSALVPNYPSIAPQSLVNANEMFMSQQGAPQVPPVTAIFTQSASEGCVPICAAEFNGNQVLWTYLMHGHWGNFPINVAAIANNPVNV